MDFKDKKVAIIGLGAEGITSATFFIKHGVRVTILDVREEKDIDKGVLQRAKELGVQLIFGKEYLKYLEIYDIILRSPGVKRFLPEILAAEKNGAEITSQTKFFFDLCPCPIIGVTGTKGKGTTSSLIYEMLRKQGFDVYLGGNIGQPPFTFLDKLSPQSIVVLELSSFQLQDLTKSPHIAVMLMVTSEHLDYHVDTEEYVDAKRNILRYQKPSDFAVINRDYLASHESDIHTSGTVFQVSRERRVWEQGCFVKDDAVWVKMEGREFKIIDTKDILLPGKHNLENVCAATMAALLAGVEKAKMKAVLQTFAGLPHRLELVREVRGVRYYDDSFSTTPETAIAAIEAFEEPEILILGGSSKNSDFTEFGKVISEHENIRAIIGIGEEWPKIKLKIKDSSFAKASKDKQKSKILMVEGAKDMHTIVQAAAKIASPGDVVLLSPACASFGMFKNYKDRGEQFKREVRKL